MCPFCALCSSTFPAFSWHAGCFSWHSHWTWSCIPVSLSKLSMGSTSIPSFRSLGTKFVHCVLPVHDWDASTTSRCTLACGNWHAWNWSAWDCMMFAGVWRPWPGWRRTFVWPTGRNCRWSNSRSSPNSLWTKAVACCLQMIFKTLAASINPTVTNMYEPILISESGRQYIVHHSFHDCTHTTRKATRETNVSFLLWLWDLNKMIVLFLKPVGIYLRCHNKL